MKAAAHPLWPRIDAFSLDRADATLTFTARLARDSGWSRAYARRVVDEYKRFMFLAVAAEHVVTPSEAIDQAWHLHLTYTRSYWGDFCGEVLGKSIHHDPTTGIAEQGKFFDLYERTRQTYEHWFGHAPPEAIWPAAEVRFGEDAQCRWVNVSRNWVIRKPAFWSRFGRRQAATLAGLAVAPPLVFAAQPIGKRGAETIFLIGGLVFAAVIIVSVIRGLLSRKNPRDKNGKRTSYDAAAGCGIAGGAVGCGAGIHGHCHDASGGDSGGDCGSSGCGGSGCGGGGCGGGGCGGG